MGDGGTAKAGRGMGNGGMEYRRRLDDRMELDQGGLGGNLKGGMDERYGGHG